MSARPAPLGVTSSPALPPVAVVGNPRAAARLAAAGVPVSGPGVVGRLTRVRVPTVFYGPGEVRAAATIATAVAGQLPGVLITPRPAAAGPGPALVLALPAPGSP